MPCMISRVQSVFELEGIRTIPLPPDRGLLLLLLHINLALLLGISIGMVLGRLLTM